MCVCVCVCVCVYQKGYDIFYKYSDTVIKRPSCVVYFALN